MNVEQGMSKEKNAYNYFDIPCSTFYIRPFTTFFINSAKGRNEAWVRMGAMMVRVKVPVMGLLWAAMEVKGSMEQQKEWVMDLFGATME